MPALAELLDALATTPDLHGAACTAHLDLFDACLTRKASPAVYSRAVEICAGCPVLTQCRAWVRHLPRHRKPFGVTAGVLRTLRSA